MKERIKNHERDIALARAHNSAISEHNIETGHVSVKDQVRFIDHNFSWYTGRVKEASHIRLYPYKKSKDNGIEIPVTWMQTIKNHESRSETKPIYEGQTSNRRNGDDDRKALIKARRDSPITK